MDGDSAWDEEARDWVQREAGRLERRVTGSDPPRVRPWATVVRIPAEGGDLWFKAPAATLAYEAAITDALSRWIPGRTPEVLAFRPERGWLLMAHGGETLRSMYETRPGPDGHCAATGVYAGLQRELVPRVPEMLALGVPDCRLSVLPRLYSDLLDWDGLQRADLEGCLIAAELDRLRRLTPRVEDLCTELAAFGIPETLQHDDLHSNNILVRGEQTIIFDWGDCSVSHPLLSLVVLLRGAERDFDEPEGGPAVQSVRQAFLDAWDLPLSPSDLDRACTVADALGRINRALTWERDLRGVREPFFSQYAAAVSEWLRDFAETSGPEFNNPGFGQGGLCTML